MERLRRRRLGQAVSEKRYWKDTDELKKTITQAYNELTDIENLITSADDANEIIFDIEDRIDDIKELLGEHVR